MVILGGGATAAGDAAARERIRNSLDESLIVEAGAGTGKTTELVQRIVNVLRTGRARIEGIAAVTFTNKAAGELKLRLRQGLDQARTAAAGSRAEERNLEEALRRLEEAAIGTIHAFCAQILRERPVEAEVDPSFREASPGEANRLFQRAFDQWIQARLNRPSPALERALSRLAWRETWDTAPPARQLQYAARQVVEWRDFPTAWMRPDLDREDAIDTLVSHVLSLDPKLNNKNRAIQDLATWIRRAEAVRERDYDALESLLLKLLRELQDSARNSGGRGKPTDDSLQKFVFALDNFKRAADAHLAATLRDEMLEVVTLYDNAKSQTGTLDFLDLQLKARDLIAARGPVRRYLQNRFTHLFIDEFQDTDPLQAEILLLLAADDGEQTDWAKARPVPGKFFAVGDPKQSIYRFRRADLSLYRSIKERLINEGVGVAVLTRSFRAARPIQELVNAAFAPEMTGDVWSGQAAYAPLEEHRPAHEGQPAIVVLPVPEPYGGGLHPRVSKAAVNASFPKAAAAYAAWLIEESGWTVAGPSGERIPIAARHIALLFRRFVNNGEDLTREYTRELEARGIPHLLVGSRSFHEREETRTLRAAITAIEWPEDELAVYATLHGSLFAISDAALFEYRHHAGRLYPLAAPPELPPGAPERLAAIPQALSLLASLHRKRNARPFAETVVQLLDAVRAHAGFALRPAGRQVLANVYRFAELARGFELDGGVSFRGFVERMREEAELAEASEAPVLEEGAEGVRLMTVHTAKGLEFPVVLLADLTANLHAREPERYADPSKRLCAHRLLRCTPWELYLHQDQELAREAAEGMRVAYVAATRARDLLIVPAVGDEPMEGWLGALNKAIYPSNLNKRKQRQAPGCPVFGPATVLARPPHFDGQEEFSVIPGLHEAPMGTHEVVWWDPSKLNLASAEDYGLRQGEFLAEDGGASLAGYQHWSQARAAAIERASHPRFDVFRATDHRLLPEGVRIEIEMVAVERAASRQSLAAGGRRFGSLVHAVLREVPLDAAPEVIEGHAETQGRLAGASPGEIQAAADTVALTLRHPLLERARAAGRLHREWPLLCRIAEFPGGVFEGVLDLAFVEEGEWQVIDFKTDAEFPANRAAYRHQLSWYALALERLTGIPARGILLSL